MRTYQETNAFANLQSREREREVEYLRAFVLFERPRLSLRNLSLRLLPLLLLLWRLACSPRKLYQILCETDPEIISWDEDGKSFHIANYEEYIEGVMPLYYRHNKLTSFQRQLNLYGEIRERENDQ